MQGKTNKVFLITARILGGIIFVLVALLFFFYWNWPFEAAGGRKYYPFIAMAIYLVGYAVALWKGNLGGLIMIASGVMLAFSPFLYLTSGEISPKVWFIVIVCLPPVVAGILFILSSKTKLTFTANQHQNT